MKLLITPTSPFARKARALILEKNLQCPCEVANPWEDAPAVAENNPLRKIPVLLTENGAIADSDLICEYLDELAPPYFLPRDFAARAAVKARGAIAQGAMEAAGAVVMAGRIDAQMQSEKWRQWLLAKAQNAAAYFEKLAPARDPQKPDMADIALFCFLDFLLFRHPQMQWQSANPALAEWFEQMKTRPSFVQTDPRE